MGFNVAIPKASLLAVSRFSGVKDIRYYLNGVCVELGQTGARLIATNGHVLGLLQIAEDFPGLAEPIQLIIPAAAAIKFKPTARGTKDVILTVDGAQKATLSDPGTGESFEFPLIDGKFPDYRRVFPTETNGQPAVFNPEYLMMVRKASIDLGNKQGGMSIQYNGEQSTLVHIDGRPDFVAIVMPVRGMVHPSTERPSWAVSSLRIEQTAPELAAA